ncbi:MAG: hypothetical protein ACTHMY_03455 [Solirubrobacteraceae bacterium]
MTAKARTKQRNASAERHVHQADIRAARIKDGTLRGELARLEAEERQLNEDITKLDVDVARDVAGAEERRDGLRERQREIDQAKADIQYDIVAAAVAIQQSQAELKALYDDPECFGQFVTEAERATAAAVTDLGRVPEVAAIAAQSWAKATSLWAPLNIAIQNRLRELNESEGRYPDTAPQASVLPFPVKLLADLAAMAPRPSGIDRLRAAGKLE